MKILIATLIKRADTRSFFFPQATASHHELRWRWQLDYFMPSSIDDDPIPAVTRKYQEARRLALAGGYDALLALESDMVIPADALEKLAAFRDVDIAYGLYVLRRPRRNWNALYGLTTNKYFSLSDEPDRARSHFGQAIEVSGIGLGCTLVWRNVLEGLDFRNRAGTFCDWTLAQDAAHLGLKQVCDMSVVCGHIDGNKVLWPDPNEESLCRIEIL